MVGSALFANGTPIPMGSVMAIAGIGSFASVLVAMRAS
jgi:hypothetical protein